MDNYERSLFSSVQHCYMFFVDFVWKKLKPVRHLSFAKSVSLSLFSIVSWLFLQALLWVLIDFSVCSASFLVGSWLPASWLSPSWLVLGCQLLGCQLLGWFLVASFLVDSFLVGSWLPASWLPASWLPASWLPASWLVLGCQLHGCQLLRCQLLGCQLLGCQLLGCQLLGWFWWVPIMILTEKFLCVCKLDCKSCLGSFGLKNCKCFLRSDKKKG